MSGAVGARRTPTCAWFRLWRPRVPAKVRLAGQAIAEALALSRSVQARPVCAIDSRRGPPVEKRWGVHTAASQLLVMEG
jgi:hypothetical protein